MKEQSKSTGTKLGTFIGVMAALSASWSLIEGDFSAAFGFLVGGAILVTLIAIFSRL